MADDDRPALPAADGLGDEVARLGVEVVGGLVQQQQVRLGGHQPGERGPRDLAPAQRRRRPVQRQAHQPDIRQGGLDAGFQAPVGVGEVVLGGGPRLDAMQPRQALSHAHQVGDGGAVRRDQRLAQHADATGDTHRPGGGREIAQDQADQRGLAHAIAPDEASAFGAESEGQIFEEAPAVRRGGGNGVQGDEGGHRRPCGHGRSGRGGGPSRCAWSAPS